MIPIALIRILSAVSAWTLPQSVTNGDSKWGTLDAPRLPEFRKPGSPFTDQDGTYSSIPSTGVVRRYNFTIHTAHFMPDGVPKEMMVVNNQFPGPMIEANWGDWIEVNVENKLKEGTSLHWHGLQQREHPWMDGVPSVMQCPIAPSASFTYRFRADVYGTSWWHSHNSAQYTAGLAGPMIIHGPSHLSKEEKYDIDLGPVFLNDWFHRPHHDILTGLMGTNPEHILAAVASQNNLINGKNSFNCSATKQLCIPGAGISKFEFEPEKKHLLRVINAGAEGQQEFSIDNHMLTVVAVDFVPVKPFTVPSISLGNGQRMDVIVKATGNPRKSYFMRATIGTLCSVATQPHALAAIYYPKVDHSKRPDSLARKDLVNNCTRADLPLEKIEPFFPIPAKTLDFTHEIRMTYGPNATGFWVWGMNGVSFRANFNNPSLLLANGGNFSFPENWNVINTQNSKVIRIHLKNTGDFGFIRHPMHLHGHDMQILASGVGEWDGAITNPENPTRRDTHIIPGNGYMVFQYEADNPGIWPFHCHIAWHSSGGMSVNIMEGIDSIRKLKIPSTIEQTCVDWHAFTNKTVVNQIDSGV